MKFTKYNNSMKNEKKKIIIIITSVVFVALLGSLFVNKGMDWYNALDKPKEWIPNFVIPIVWTIIYTLFIVVLSLWVKKEDLNRKIITLLIINGILNVLWCLVFFTFHLLLIGNIVIIINTLLAITLIDEISKINNKYALILTLYPLWVTIATTLNNVLWILN